MAEDEDNIDHESNVPIRVQRTLVEIMREHPDGMSTSEICDFYQFKKGYSMNPLLWSMNSVSDVVASLTKIFRLVKCKTGNILVFPAFLPMSQSEKEILDEPFETVPIFIKCNLRKLLLKNNREIYLDNLQESYRNEFKCPIYFETYGYNSIESFVDALDGKLLKKITLNDKVLLALIEEVKESPCSVVIEEKMDCDIFPVNCISPDEHLKNISTNCLTPSEMIKIRITCPSYTKSYLKEFNFILLDYLESYLKMGDEMTNFYVKNRDAFKMPEWVAEQGIYCATFTRSNQWFRAQILSSTKDTALCINLDYGNVSTVPKTRLCYLHKDFVQLPCQYFKGKLAFCHPAFNEYTKEADEYFGDMTGGDLTASVHTVDSEKSLVTLFVYVEECDLLTLLVKKKFAVRYNSPKIKEITLLTGKHVEPVDKITLKESSPKETSFSLPLKSECCEDGPKTETNNIVLEKEKPVIPSHARTPPPASSPAPTKTPPPASSPAPIITPPPASSPAPIITPPPASSPAPRPAPAHSPALPPSPIFSPLNEFPPPLTPPFPPPYRPVLQPPPGFSYRYPTTSQMLTFPQNYQPYMNTYYAMPYGYNQMQYLQWLQLSQLPMAPWLNYPPYPPPCYSPQSPALPSPPPNVKMENSEPNNKDKECSSKRETVETDQPTKGLENVPNGFQSSGSSHSNETDLPSATFQCDDTDVALSSGKQENVSVTEKAEVVDIEEISLDCFTFSKITIDNLPYLLIDEICVKFPGMSLRHNFPENTQNLYESRLITLETNPQLFTKLQSMELQYSDSAKEIALVPMEELLRFLTSVTIVPKELFFYISRFMDSHINYGQIFSDDLQYK